MLDQIGEKLAAPADAAFEEAEAQIREAPRDAAEEQPLRHRVPGRREMADMVEGEIARVVAQSEAAAAGVEGRRDAEFAAFLPDRIVIVVAVEAELVVQHRVARHLRVQTLGHGFLGSRQWPRDAAAEHADLRAELLDAELKLRDRLLRGVHRDHRGRGQPVAKLREILGRDDVEAADHGAAGLVVGDARDAETGGRIDDAEIDAQLVEPVVQHLGAASPWRGRACWSIADPNSPPSRCRAPCARRSSASARRECAAARR